MKRFAAALAVLAMAGCSADFDGGEAIIARVQRDPSNPCRIIVTQHVMESIQPIVANIEGCTAEPKP